MLKNGAEVISVEATAHRSVYIVDDDPDVLASLVFFLANENWAATAFESGGAFLDKVYGLVPSPVLLDLQMPEMSGLEVLDELVNRNIYWPVIVITGHGAVESAVAAMKLGAMDFLEKPVDSGRTIATLNKAFTLLDESQQHHLEQESARARVASLTTRQAMVIEALMRGQTNRQVASDLSLSPRTVEMHRASALGKMGIHTLVEAVSLFSHANRLTAHSAHPATHE